jgi:hypothetical protein
MAARELAGFAIEEASLRRLASIAAHLFRGRATPPPGPLPRRHRSGAGTDFLGHRDYAPGDDLRAIDWRATARASHFQVKQFGAETSARWMLCLDRSASMSLPDPGKWRLAMELAAAFAYLLLHAGHRVGLLAFSGEVDCLCPAGGGREHYARLLAILRRAAPDPEGGASRPESCAKALPDGASVLLVGDLLRPDGMLPALDRLLRAGHPVQVLQVLSERECRPMMFGDAVDYQNPLPSGEGRVRGFKKVFTPFFSNATAPNSPALLRDAETGDRIPVVLSEPTLQAAEAELDRLVAEVRSYCRRRGLVHTLCRTSAAWDRWLVEHLRRLEAGHA